MFRVAATAFSIDSILQSSSSPSSSSNTASSSPLTPLTSSPLFSGLSSPLLSPFPQFPASFSCLPPFLPPPELLPPLIPKHLAVKEPPEEPERPLSLFPGVYGAYPGGEGGGPGGVAGGMLSQVSQQPIRGQCV